MRHSIRCALSLICIAALSEGILTSCGDTAAVPTVDTAETAIAETTAETEETAALVTDDLPEKDFDGFEFHIFTRTNTTHYQFTAEEETGETLNDAIYRRNLAIEERFHIKIDETEYETETQPNTLVLAGDNTYSLMNVRCNVANTMAQNRYSVDISELPYINLQKPYWDYELTDSIAVGTHYYVPIGASSLTSIDFMTVTLFNKELITTYDLESPYTLVENGTWTLDKYQEMGMAATVDLNGDGTMDENDQWGALGVAKYLHISLLLGSDVQMIHKDADGYPVYNMAGDETFVNAFNKVFEVCNESGIWYRTTDDTNEATKYHEMFRNGQGLFMTTLFYYIESLRDMDQEFGILPFPKYDETQERYRNRISFFDATVIPTSAQNTECSSIILEALNCASYNSVVPAYYDIVLKGKYARDEESAAMLDILMNNRVLDLGDTYYVSNIRDGFLAKLFAQNKKDIVSAAQKQEKSVNKVLTQVITAYEEMGE